MKEIKEENQFLSYIHMAASTFRIYASNCDILTVKEFLNGIIERISTHEAEIKEVMTIRKEGNELSLMQKFALCMIKMKAKSSDEFGICIEALKAIDMGTYQVSAFIKRNKNHLSKDFIKKATGILQEYDKINREMKEFINHQYL